MAKTQDTKPKAVITPPSAVVEFVPVPNDLKLEYVDSWQPTVSGADIKLRVGTVLGPIETGMAARLVSTLIFTHSGFVRFARDLNRIVALLQEVYDGDPPALDRKTTEELHEIIKRHTDISGASK